MPLGQVHGLTLTDATTQLRDEDRAYNIRSNALTVSLALARGKGAGLERLGKFEMILV